MSSINQELELASPTLPSREFLPHVHPNPSPLNLFFQPHLSYCMNGSEEKDTLIQSVQV